MVSHTIIHDRILKSHLIVSENKQGAIRSSRIYKNLKKNNSNENLIAGMGPSNLSAAESSRILKSFVFASPVSF